MIKIGKDVFEVNNRISDILSVAADMEAYLPAGDSLTALIGTYADYELNEEDLSFVSAAGSLQSFEAFRRRFHLDSK